jgi:hypothetical protein
MANEFKHLSVGGEITQAEYEAVGGHVLESQAIGDIIYASAADQLRRLGIGSTGAVLTVTGGIPAWDTTWTPTGHLIPAADDTYDLGSASAAWQDLFLEGGITLTDAGTLATSAGGLTITSAAAATWSTSAGALTVTSAGALNLNPAGGSAIVLDTSTTLDGGVLTFTPSTSDTVVMTAATNGAFSLVTTDNAAAAANIQITADGTVDIDSAGILTLDSGAAINIEPASGSAILLDGTISIDAGVVTGATSVTSTAFVGDITGDVTGNADTVTTNANLTGDVTSTGNATAIAAGVIVNADVNASAAIAVSKTALSAGTGLTLSTNSLSVDAAQTQITSVGALDAGSISTNFGVINNGASAITTTGLVSAGSLTVTGTTTLNGNLILGDAAADTLTISATIQGATPLAFEGGTANGFETSVAIADPSADRTITFPDATLTVNAAGDISGTTLASNVVTSSLTAVATIGTGVWAATDVAVAHGGTGASTATAGFDALSPMTAEGDILYGGSSGTVTKLAKGSDADVLTLASGIPSWATPTTGDITGVTAGTGLSGGGSSGSVTLNVEASQTQITAVGDLGTGSITSNFGTINNGSSTITTTGAVATGALTPSSIAFTGNLYLTGTLTTASNTNNYMVRFNEADSSVTASAANSGTGASGYAFVAIDGEAIAAASSYTFAESSSLMITGPPTAGTNMTLTQTFALNVVAGDVSIAPTAKLFLDGGSNTYIYEESGDDLHIVVGGVSIIQIDQDGPHTTIQGPLRLRNIAGDGNSEFKQSTGNIQGTTTTPVNLGYDLGGAGGDTAFIYVNSMRTDTSYHGNGDLLFVHDNQIVSIAHVGDGTTATYAMSGGQVTIAFSTGTWDTNWWILDPGDPG